MQADLRAKFLLHFPTLPTIGMRRQILVTIPNMKFYENPWGRIRCVPFGQTEGQKLRGL